MWAYIICAAIWVAIIVGWLIPVARKRLVAEVYMACGLGIMFSLIVLGSMIWEGGDILPLLYMGFALYVPAAAFVISSFIALRHKGKPESGWEPTTVLVEDGVFRIVRHPLYLGAAIWTMGIILVLQSIASIIPGLVGIFCFWMASRKEDGYNMRKFGDKYAQYMDRVPMWNFFKGLISLRKG